MAMRSWSKKEMEADMQNIVCTLTLLEPFGYKPIWPSVASFIESFRVGPVCDKYLAFLDYLQHEMIVICQEDINEVREYFELFKTTLVSQDPEGISFRLRSVSQLTTRLFNIRVELLRGFNSSTLQQLKAVPYPRFAKEETPRKIDKIYFGHGDPMYIMAEDENLRWPMVYIENDLSNDYEFIENMEENNNNNNSLGYQNQEYLPFGEDLSPSEEFSFLQPSLEDVGQDGVTWDHMYANTYSFDP